MLTILCSLVLRGLSAGTVVNSWPTYYQIYSTACTKQVIYTEKKYVAVASNISVAEIAVLVIPDMPYMRELQR